MSEPETSERDKAWIEGKEWRPSTRSAEHDARVAAIVAAERAKGAAENAATGASLFDVDPGDDVPNLDGGDDRPDDLPAQDGELPAESAAISAPEVEEERPAPAVQEPASVDPRRPLSGAVGVRGRAIHTGDEQKWGDRGAQGGPKARSQAPSDALFDTEQHRATRHPFDADAFGRCKVCGLVPDGSDSVHTPGLADKFLVPPFSVLDTRQDYWQKRRRSWLSLGIRGETSAEQSYTPQKGGAGKTATGTYSGHGNAALLKAEREGLHEPQARKGAFNVGGDTDSRIVTTADQRPREEMSEAERRAEGQRRGTLADGSQGLDGAQQKRAAFNQSSIAAHGGLGRKQGLIYQHDAPASDPSFYTKKTAVEKQLGREISIEEFRRDHYKREEQDLGQSQSVQTGTSVFDPVLCEIAYRWFSAPGGRVLDPFAGGVVRGLIAGALGREYTGTELRPEQIADNREQAERLLDPASGIDWGLPPVMPTWIEHDATEIGALGIEPVDLVFTCPPYADLEVYSNDPRDLSTKPYPEFAQLLGEVMKQTAAALKPNRFAVWVVGEARGGSQTAEYGLVADTVKSAQAAGLALYNSAILLNSVGSAALRAQLIMRSRKVTRVHQHVLVFLKGDHKKAAKACGEAALDG